MLDWMTLNTDVQIPGGSLTRAYFVAKTLHAATDCEITMPTARLAAIARFPERPSEADVDALVQQYVPHCIPAR
jgi:hypothetical protein